VHHVGYLPKIMTVQARTSKGSQATNTHKHTHSTPISNFKKSNALGLRLEHMADKTTSTFH
jgi:hypothetical protein